MDESAALNAYEWLQKRLRPDADRSQEPTPGFGPGGVYTCWLPSTRASARLIFKDGKPAYETVANSLDDPKLLAARNTAIEGLREIAPGQVGVFIETFYAYAAEILRRNYTLSDDDLTTLLAGTDRWHAAVVAHLCGGRDYIEALERYAPGFYTASELAMRSENSQPTSAPITIPPRKRPHLKTRIQAAWKILRDKW